MNAPSSLSSKSFKPRFGSLSALAAATAVVAWCGLCSPAVAQTTRGVVQALNEATLSSEIAARVVAMPLRVGDTFAKGDVLVRFDCALFEAQRDKVDAEVRAAEARHANDQQLEQMRSIGALEVTLSAVALQQAKAELRMAQLNTQRCTIRAPWNGRVVQRMSNEQESVKLNQDLLAIASTQELEMMLVVPATWLRWMKPGTAFEVRMDETGTSHKAQVAALGSKVDAVSQTLNLRARLPADARLLPGMTGTARFGNAPN